MPFPVCLSGEQNCKTVAHFKQGQNWLRTILLSSFTQVESKSLNKWHLRCSFLNKYLKGISQQLPFRRIVLSVKLLPSVDRKHRPRNHICLARCRLEPPRPSRSDGKSCPDRFCRPEVWRQGLKSADFRQLYFLGYVCIKCIIKVIFKSMKRI